MLNLDNIVSNKIINNNNNNNNNNWPFRMLIIGPSGSGKTKVLLHLINNSHPIDKIIEYSDDMDDVLDDINNYNQNRDKKVLIVFDDMIADIEYDKKFKRIVKELFFRARKINVSVVFITQSYFRVLKDARLNSTHYILMKINNKKELKRIAEEKSGHLDYKDFLEIYNYCTREPYSFMLIDTRSNTSIPFKKNFDEPLKNDL